MPWLPDTKFAVRAAGPPVCCSGCGPPPGPAGPGLKVCWPMGCIIWPGVGSGVGMPLMSVVMMLGRRDRPSAWRT